MFMGTAIRFVRAWGWMSTCSEGQFSVSSLRFSGFQVFGSGQFLFEGQHGGEEIALLFDAFEDLVGFVCELLRFFG